MKAIGLYKHLPIEDPVSALDAVPELVSILTGVKAGNDIIKKPVALDDFMMAVKTALLQ